MKALLIAFTGLLAASMASLAQTPLDPIAPAENCVAEVVPEGEESTAALPEAEADTELGAKLERCGSVLRPPPTGDQELVEPAPATGDATVISPEQLPEQQPPQPQ